MTDRTPDGILLVDKAEGWTSHDVVAKARRALGTRKVGHAGTLDPMATGLLLLGAGPATRLLTHLVGLDKTYTATLRLGSATVTDDREGETLSRAPEGAVAALAADPGRIRRAAETLTGAIEQAPSAVSAIKVGGRRAYDLVRAGEQVELKKRPVTIHTFELGEPVLVEPVLVDPGAVDPGVLDPAAVHSESGAAVDIEATVRCSSGTYVRALARDLGEALGVGGHLVALRRTEVGPFAIADAVPTESLSASPPGTLGPERLLAPADVAARLFPVLALEAPQEIDLGHGKRLELHEGQRLSDGSRDAGLAAAIAPGGRLVGLVEVKRGRTRVVTNFPLPGPAA